MNNINKDFNKFSDVVRYIRWYARISQEQLSKEVDSTQTSVSAWERDLYEPTYSILKRLKNYIKKNNIPVEIL